MANAALSLGRRVRENILQRVNTHEWRPGHPIPSIRALAEAHDVSAGTVRNTIRDLVVEGVLETVHGKGTFVAHPRDMSGGQAAKSSTILLVMPRLPAVETLRTMALERGILLAHYHTDVDHQDPAVERRLLELALESRYLGVIITPTPRQPVNRCLFAKLRRAGIRVLLTGRYAENMPDEACLLPDFEGATNMLARRLVEAGYSRLAMVRLGDVSSTLVGASLLRGYERAVDDLGVIDIPLHVPWRRVAPEGSLQAALAVYGEHLRSRLAALPAGTAVVTLGVLHARLVLTALRELGRAGPADVGVAAVRRFYTLEAPPTGLAHVSFDLDATVAKALHYITAPGLDPAKAYRQLQDSTFFPGPSIVHSPAVQEVSLV